MLSLSTCSVDFNFCAYSALNWCFSVSNVFITEGRTRCFISCATVCCSCLETSCDMFAIACSFWSWSMVRFTLRQFSNSFDCWSCCRAMAKSSSLANSAWMSSEICCGFVVDWTSWVSFWIWQFWSWMRFSRAVMRRFSWCSWDLSRCLKETWRMRNWEHSSYRFESFPLKRYKLFYSILFHDTKMLKQNHPFLTKHTFGLISGAVKFVDC